jgi:adenosylcobinamide-phosphate synthase
VLSGAVFTGILVSGTWSLSWILVYLTQAINPWFSLVVEIVLLYFCLSASSLALASRQVLIALMNHGIAEARRAVSWIVGRETERLDDAGVLRAAVETTAENLVDGVLAPLFWYAVGGIPMALTYKMVNTLDSMVGYRNERYIHFGKVSARLDDILNFIPARLSVPVIAMAAEILAHRGKIAFLTAVEEGSHHLSPNSGRPEAAFAGALGVRLNGPNRYHGRLVEKPYIGARFPDIQPIHVDRACDIMILSALLWVAAQTAFSVWWCRPF